MNRRGLLALAAGAASRGCWSAGLAPPPPSSVHRARSRPGTSSARASAASAAPRCAPPGRCASRPARGSTRATSRTSRCARRRACSAWPAPRPAPPARWSAHPALPERGRRRGAHRRAGARPRPCLPWSGQGVCRLCAYVCPIGDARGGAGRTAAGPALPPRGLRGMRAVRGGLSGGGPRHPHRTGQHAPGGPGMRRRTARAGSCSGRRPSPARAPPPRRSGWRTRDPGADPDDEGPVPLLSAPLRPRRPGLRGLGCCAWTGTRPARRAAFSASTGTPSPGWSTRPSVSAARWCAGETAWWRPRGTRRSASWPSGWPRVRARFGPEAVAFQTGWPLVRHPLMDWIHRLARAWGTPNVVSVASLCETAGRMGQALTVGSKYRHDLRRTQTLVALGRQPDAQHAAARARRGPEGDGGAIWWWWIRCAPSSPRRQRSTWRCVREPTGPSRSGSSRCSCPRASWTGAARRADGGVRGARGAGGLLPAAADGGAHRRARGADRPHRAPPRHRDTDRHLVGPGSGAPRERRPDGAGHRRAGGALPTQRRARDPPGPHPGPRRRSATGPLPALPRLSHSRARAARAAGPPRGWRDAPALRDLQPGGAGQPSRPGHPRGPAVPGARTGARRLERAGDLARERGARAGGRSARAAGLGGSIPHRQRASGARRASRGDVRRGRGRGPPAARGLAGLEGGLRARRERWASARGSRGGAGPMPRRHRGWRFRQPRSSHRVRARGGRAAGGHALGEDSSSPRGCWPGAGHAALPEWTPPSLRPSRRLPADARHRGANPRLHQLAVPSGGAHPAARARAHHPGASGGGARRRRGGPARAWRWSRRWAGWCSGWR